MGEVNITCDKIATPCRIDSVLKSDASSARHIHVDIHLANISHLRLLRGVRASLKRIHTGLRGYSVFTSAIHLPLNIAGAFPSMTSNSGVGRRIDIRMEESGAVVGNCVKVADGQYECKSSPEQSDRAVGAAVASAIGAPSFRQDDIDRWALMRDACMCEQTASLLERFLASLIAVPRLQLPADLEPIWTDFRNAVASNRMNEAHTALNMIANHPRTAQTISYPLEQQMAMTLPILLPALAGTFHTVLTLVKPPL